MGFSDFDNLGKQLRSGEWDRKTQEQQQSDIDQLRGLAKHTEKQLERMLNLVSTLEALKKGSKVNG